jgi:hypothetical protein
LYVAEPTPIDSEVQPQPDFLVWDATVRDTDESLEIALSRRDAYKLLESRIMTS